jgi:acetyl esterase/lipase
VTEPLVIPLFPSGAPGSEDWDQIESEGTLPDGLPIVCNVVQPSLTVYPAPNPNGAAVIVAPGGAWHFLAIEHEGRAVARWLNTRGITALILKYRLLRTGADVSAETRAFVSSGRASRQVEYEQLLKLNLADAQQAMRIARQRALEWSADPERIGFMGFSAGGGVATLLATGYTHDSKPAFVAPIYAAVFDPVQVPADAPPLFLLCTATDGMASNASLLLYSSWLAAKRPVELHIYAKGDHGFGMNVNHQPADTWVERFTDWLGGLGML